MTLPLLYAYPPKQRWRNLFPLTYQSRGICLRILMIYSQGERISSRLSPKKCVVQQECIESTTNTPTLIHILMSNFYKILWLKIFLLGRKKTSTLLEEPWEYPGWFRETECYLSPSWSQPTSLTLVIRLEVPKPTFWLTRSLCQIIYGEHQGCVNMTCTPLVQPTHSLHCLEQQNIFLPIVGLADLTQQAWQNMRTCKICLLEIHLSARS